MNNIDKYHSVFSDALAAARIASWRIEVDEGKEPRMYGDATLLDLLGVDRNAPALTPEQLYHAWYDRVDSAHYEAVAEGVGHMMKDELAEIQYPWHHPDGRIIVVRCGGIRDKSYTAGTRVAGIHQWVTTMYHVDRDLEHQQAQLKSSLAQLKDKDARFNVVKEIIHAGLWNFKVNAKDEVVAAEYSDEIAKYLNVDAALATTGPNAWKTLVHPKDRKAAYAAFYATIKDHSGKTPYDVVYRMIDKDGKYRWYRSSGQVIRHSDGTGDFFGIQINVTKMIEKEHEQQRQLKEALMMAQSANRAKTMFLNNMSHDIRTPMNAIIGYTGLAASHIESKELVEGYLAKISQSSDHLLSLINDVLDMARIESGKMTLSLKKESILDIVDSLRNIIQNQVNAKGQKLSVDCREVKDKIIFCDKLRLSQILLNVLSNAVKYTPAGGRVSIKVKEARHAAGAKKARYIFTIKDSGVGMSTEYKKEIFKPFSRAQNSTMSGVQGTGLGMAIVKNVVDMMGGEVKVRSKVNAGTEVTIAVDFKLGSVKDGGSKAKSKPKEAPKAKVQAPKSAESWAKGLRVKRVLLVEDNDINREIASTILVEGGFKVETAVNGKEAVEKVKSAAYDLVLMDIQMPVMNGYEAARAIRKWESKRRIRKGVPIIAMTANAFAEDRKLAIKSGMNEHLAKPVKIDALMNCISQFGKA